MIVNYENFTYPQRTAGPMPIVIDVNKCVKNWYPSNSALKIRWKWFTKSL